MHFRPLSLVLKQINIIYTERALSLKDKQNLSEYDMCTFAYSILLNQYQNSKMTEQKFLIFLLSIKKYISQYRVNVFARFLGLLQQQNMNYSIEECNKYAEAYLFITIQSEKGCNIENIENGPKLHVPYVRAIEYLKHFADTRLSKEECIALQKEAEAMKEVDPNQKNLAGLIDFDIFMFKILQKYKLLITRAKTYVINAFAACDLDGNGQCDLNEFLLLNRHIEATQFDQEKVESMFLENADVEIEGEKLLSFDKFSIVCVEFNLFSDLKQNEYLGIEKFKEKLELTRLFKEIKQTWPEKSKEIQERLKNLTIITSEEIKKWEEIIAVLDQRIMQNTETEIKPILIAYNILDRETEMFLEQQQQGSQILDDSFCVSECQEYQQQQDSMLSNFKKFSEIDLPEDQIENLKDSVQNSSQQFLIIKN